MILAVLEDRFSNNRNDLRAVQMERYMKNKFTMYGMPMAERRSISNAFFKENNPPKDNSIIPFIELCWEQEKREFHYVGMEYAEKCKLFLDPDNFSLFEFLITNHSWWDTVDFIASHLVGKLILNNPDKFEELNSYMVSHENLWMRRTSLIYQLFYKEKTREDFLFQNCLSLINEEDFFIRKAIGWSLRQHSKLNPKSVSAFVSTHPFSPLSNREALKHIK